MRHTPTATWVVYQTPFRNKPGLVTVICEQSEWDAMELSRPGYHTLVKAGIVNECEAERLARDAVAAETQRVNG